ncbi:hypothetical protein BaRGS_00001195, partial [Batillaria attramentaria]
VLTIVYSYCLPSQEVQSFKFKFDYSAPLNPFTLFALSDLQPQSVTVPDLNCYAASENCVTALLTGALEFCRKAVSL